MIVVVIIGILTTIALPAYQDYQIRARNSEGLMALSSCKTALASAAMVGMSSYVNPDNVACSFFPWKGRVLKVGDLGMAMAQNSDTEVGIKVKVPYANDKGRNEFMLIPFVNENGKQVPIQQKHFRYGTNLPIAQWRCGPLKSGGGGFAMPEKYLPHTCRDEAPEFSKEWHTLESKK